LRKYGVSSEVWQLEELCIAFGIKNAAIIERMLISEYDTYISGYNSSKGGEMYDGYTKRKRWNNSRKQHMSKIHNTKNAAPNVIS